MYETKFVIFNLAIFQKKNLTFLSYRLTLFEIKSTESFSAIQTTSAKKEPSGDLILILFFWEYILVWYSKMFKLLRVFKINIYNFRLESNVPNYAKFRYEIFRNTSKKELYMPCCSIYFSKWINRWLVRYDYVFSGWPSNK